MSSDEEHKKQSHKGHKVNLKLKKKRKADKELKKKKTLSNKAYALIKDDERCKFFSQRDKIRSHQSIDKYGVRVDLLKKLLKKFMIVYNDELQDFYDIFQQLDDGAEIQTSGIDNGTIRENLEQIFKILKMQKSEQGQEIRYKHTNKGFKLLEYVKLKIDSIMDYVEDSDVLSSEEEVEKEAKILTQPKSIQIPQKKKNESNQQPKPIVTKKQISFKPEFDRKDVEIKLKNSFQPRLNHEMIFDENNTFLDDLFLETQTKSKIPLQQIDIIIQEESIQVLVKQDTLNQSTYKQMLTAPIPQKKEFNKLTDLSKAREIDMLQFKESFLTIQ